MNKLILSCKDITYLIAHNDILYCKSDNSYTRIFTTNEGDLVTSKAIYKLQEDLLDENFIRVGQSPRTISSIGWGEIRSLDFSWEVSKE